MLLFSLVLSLITCVLWMTKKQYPTIFRGQGSMSQELKTKFQVGCATVVPFKVEIQSDAIDFGKKNTGFLALFRILLVQNAVRGWRPPDRGRLVPFVLSCHHEGKMNSFSFYCRSVDITRTESRRVHSKSKTMTNNEITCPEVYWMALHGYIWFTEIRGGQTFWIADLVYMCYDVFF